MKRLWPTRGCCAMGKKLRVMFFFVQRAYIAYILIFMMIALLRKKRNI